MQGKLQSSFGVHRASLSHIWKLKRMEVLWAISPRALTSQNKSTGISHVWTVQPLALLDCLLISESKFIFYSVLFWQWNRARGRPLLLTEQSLFTQPLIAFCALQPLPVLLAFHWTPSSLLTMLSCLSGVAQIWTWHFRWDLSSAEQREMKPSLKLSVRLLLCKCASSHWCPRGTNWNMLNFFPIRTWSTVLRHLRLFASSAGLCVHLCWSSGCSCQAPCEWQPSPQIY